MVKAQFPCIFARVIETPWYTGDCRATSCLFWSATLSKQFPRFHSNYRTQPTSSSRDKTCTLSSSIITNKLGTCARASDVTDLRDWKSTCGYREESSYTHKMADRQQLSMRGRFTAYGGFERPRSPTWTSPQLTASAFLESSSLCHVLCECHDKAGPYVGTNVDISSSNSFLIQRIFLHSDTHR